MEDMRTLITAVSVVLGLASCGTSSTAQRPTATPVSAVVDFTASGAVTGHMAGVSAASDCAVFENLEAGPTGTFWRFHPTVSGVTWSLQIQVGGRYTGPGIYQYPRAYADFSPDDTRTFSINSSGGIDAHLDINPDGKSGSLDATLEEWPSDSNGNRNPSGQFVHLTGTFHCA